MLEPRRQSEATGGSSKGRWVGRPRPGGLGRTIVSNNHQDFPQIGRAVPADPAEVAERGIDRLDLLRFPERRIRHDRKDHVGGPGGEDQAYQKGRREEPDRTGPLRAKRVHWLPRREVGTRTVVESRLRQLL